MRTLLLGLFILIQPVAAAASGWNDYTIPIGDGFSIIRANSFDVMLAQDEKIIVSNYDFDIGPITYYYKNDKYILLKTAGWKFRNLFEGDKFREIDYSKVFHFLIRIEDRHIDGPLSEQSFLSHPAVSELADIAWIESKNPNILRPLLGNVMFLMMAIPILGIKFWYITVLLIFLVIYWRRKQRLNRNTGTAT